MQIGQVAYFQNGYAFKSKDFVKNGKYKIIKIKELKDGKVRFFNDSASVDVDDKQIIEKYIVKNGDILFALTGDPVNKKNPLSWVGRVSVYEDNQLALLNQRVCKLIPKEELNAKYIYYYFRAFNNFYALASIAKGSASQANISTKDIESMEVALPSLNIQDKIVLILDSIEEKISQNNKINENLYEQMLSIFNNARRTSAWNKHKLGDVLIFFDNLRKPLSSIQREKMAHIYPYYGAASIVDYVEDYLFDGTYILISEDGANVIDSFGHPLTQYTYGKFWVNNHAHIVKGSNGYSEALVYAMHGTLNMQSIVTGAAQPKINKANLRNFEAVLPESEEAQVLSELLNPMLQQMLHHDQENEKLSELRDILLPQLMSGALDVSAIDL